jgi:transposase
MAVPKFLFIKESLADLKVLLKNSKPSTTIKLRMLIELKKAGEKGLSKRVLADMIGVNHNSIQSWKTTYEKKGLIGLCNDGRIGFKPSVITKEEHEAIDKKLRDPKNGLRGYKELQEWIENEYNKTIKYNTLLKYSVRHFESKSKVARKSHIKKDEQKVDDFKKTLVQIASKSAKKTGMNSKK